MISIEYLEQAGDLIADGHPYAIDFAEERGYSLDTVGHLASFRRAFAEYLEFYSEGYLEFNSEGFFDEDY